MDPVDGEVAAVLLRGPHEIAAQLGPRRLRRRRDRGRDLVVGAHPRRATGPLQQVEDTAAGLDVVIGHVELLNPRVVEFEGVLGGVLVEQLLLDHPIDLGVDPGQIARLDRGQGAAPQVEHPGGGGVADALAFDKSGGPLEVLRLHRQRRDLLAVGKAHLRASGDVVAHLADRPDRVLQREVTHRRAVLDHLQHQVRRTQLEHGRRLGHVAVADDHVQSAVVLGVGVRFVAGVDDRTRAGGGAADALPDVVGPLTHRIDRTVAQLHDFACATGDLAADQERDQVVGDALEVTGARHQVVLVAAVGVAGGVGVVLEDVDVPDDLVGRHPLLGVDGEVDQDALPGLVLDDRLADVVALGCGVLGVAADVEVEPRAVAEEHIARAAPRHDAAEQVARHLVRRQPPGAAGGARHAVLGLDAKDAPLHVTTLCSAAAPTRHRPRPEPRSRRGGGCAEREVG